MSAACAPATVPNSIAASRNLRIVTFPSITPNTRRSSLVNLNQSLSRGVRWYEFLLAAHPRPHCHPRAKRGIQYAPVPIVMAGLVPAIHAFDVARFEDVDARNKCGHDESAIVVAGISGAGAKQSGAG